MLILKFSFSYSTLLNNKRQKSKFKKIYIETSLADEHFARDSSQTRKNEYIITFFF